MQITFFEWLPVAISVGIAAWVHYSLSLQHSERCPPQTTQYPTLVQPHIIVDQPSLARGREDVYTANLFYNASRMEFALASDLDRESRDPQKFLWRSVFKRGTLINDPDTGFRIEWWREQMLETSSSRDNRSMELSELIKFRHFLLGVCDYTGLVFRIAYGDNQDRHNNLEATNEEPKVFQRWAIADGDGHKAKPFKMEWATTKDGLLFLGSSGVEWLRPNGDIVHEDPMWVKTIDEHGSVQNLDWRPIYRSIRLACNISTRGYIWHEAVYWDVPSRRWYFLPRKASQLQYHPHADQWHGTNLLIVANEDFSEIDVKTVGVVEPEYGYTSLKKIPGSRNAFMALKVREIVEDGNIKPSTHTKLCIFDEDGRFYLESGVEQANGFVHVSDLKFEGLEFL